MLFCVVASEKSYSEAGRQLGLSRSTVSRRMQRLEKHLGVRLFVRDTRHFSLSSSGEKLLAHGVELKLHIETIEREMRALADEPAGIVRCTASTTLAARLGGLLASEFKERYPDIEIQWDAGEQLADLLDGNIDLAIRIHRVIDDQNVVARQLAPAPVVLAASPEYLRHSKPLVKVDDLEQHDCIVLSSNPGTWTMKDRDDSPIEVPVTGRLKAGTDAAVIEASLNHMGVIYVPRFCIEPYVASGRLQVVLPNAAAMRHIYLVYSHRELPKKTRVLVDFLAGLGERRFIEAISQQRLAENA